MSILPSLDGSTSPHFPRILASAAGMPIALVGGVIVPEKLRWAQQLGLNIQWVVAKDRGGDVHRLIHRIYAGHVWGVVMLNELIAHKHSVPVHKACSDTVTRYVLGRKGGQGHLLEAFGTWESLLR